MTFQLKDIVPWGRSFDEYVAMFALSNADLGKHILGCGDGPANFNAELCRRGGSVVSIDPPYAYSQEAIGARIDEAFTTVMQETRKHQNEFVWEHIRSIDELGKLRMAAMQDFLQDYPQGRIDGRYLPNAMPKLRFADDSFSLALSSHFLFLYSGHLDLAFHIDAITEMCRVAGEARVFPLLQLGAIPSPHVQAVTDHFLERGYEVTTTRVSYEFQRCGNQMLRIKKPL